MNCFHILRFCIIELKTSNSYSCVYVTSDYLCHPHLEMDRKRGNKFRPCIDLHNGQVKQIIGGTLSDENPNSLKTNFVAR